MRFLALLGFAPAEAHAAIEQLGSGSPGIDSMWAQIKSLFPHTNVGGNGVAYLALKFTDLFLRVIGGIAVAVIIYAGLRMVISRGNDEGFGEAKKILQYTVMGLIFVLVADAVILYAASVITAASQ